MFTDKTAGESAGAQAALFTMLWQIEQDTSDLMIPRIARVSIFSAKSPQYRQTPHPDWKTDAVRNDMRRSRRGGAPLL